MAAPHCGGVESRHAKRSIEAARLLRQRSEPPARNGDCGLGRASATGMGHSGAKRAQHSQSSAWPAVTNHAARRIAERAFLILEPALPSKPPRQSSPWQGAADAARRSQRAAADRRRGKTAERGYDAAWRRLRLTYLREHPLCRMCEAQGRTTAATVVDHVRPIAERPDLRLEWSNLQALCAPHHDRDKQRLDRRARQAAR